MKNLILCLALGLTFSVQAQKDKYTTHSAEQVCDCLNKKKESKSKETFDKLILDCMLDSDCIKDYKKIAVENNIDVKDGFGGDTGEQIGRIIGLKLMTMKCDGFTSLVSDMVSEKDKSDEEKIESEFLQKIQSNLTFVKVEKTDNFNIVVFKDAKGKEVKLWWLEYFEGSDAIKNNTLRGSNITCSFVEKEFFNPKMNDYIKVKVITGLFE